MALVCPSCGAHNNDGADMCFTCGRGLSGLTQGSVIDSRYEILEPLGKGGMGMVYKAHDRELGEIVALKLLRTDVAQSPEMGKRFRSEIKLARKVRHPNVCAIYEYGQHGSLQFIAMEHVEGTDLKQELRSRGGLPPDEAYEVAVQLAEGLQAVHNVGVIHRDLKTPNIMRDRQGVLRLMDFGIAKQYGAVTTGATVTGHIVGTPEYMSPEQCRGEKIDTRSDIYALGVVIFEIFTGEVPFRGDTPVATLFKHMLEPPPLEGEMARRLPPALLPILRRTLAKSPDARYASAREVAEALRTARARLPPRASLAPTPRPVHTATAAQPVKLQEPETTPTPTPVPTPVPTLSPTAVPAAATIVPPQRPNRTPEAAVPRLPPASPTVAEQPPVPRAERRGAAPTPRARAPGFPWAIAAGLVCLSAFLLVGTFLFLRARESEAPAVVPASLAEARTPATLPLPTTVRLPTTASQATPPPTQPPVTATAPPRPPVARPTLLVPSAQAQLAYPDPARASTRLSWKTVPDAVGYHFVLAPNADFARPVVDRSKVSDSAIELRGLAAGSYSWRVAGVDRDGHEGAFSEALRFTIARPVAEVRTSAPPATLLTAGGAPTPAAQVLAPATGARPETAPPASTASPDAELAGLLRLAIRPYADVSVDGKAVGTTPMKPLTLTAGVHMVVLSNPGFQPLNKKVTIEPGKTAVLDVDLTFEAFPK